MNSEVMKEFDNPARRLDGASIILEIKKLAEWRYEYLPPGTSQNRGLTWKLPRCKRIVEHLRICGGVASFLVGVICDGSMDNMQQVLVLILDELDKTDNKEHKKEWQRLVKLGERAGLRFGTDNLLGNYRMGRAKNMQVIQKIGSNSMPETFGKEQAPIADTGKKDELDSMIDGLKDAED